MKILNKKGFTLVELLVVVAIIGVLSSVAVVQLNVARDKARLAALQATMDETFNAILLCHDEGSTIENGAGAACKNWAQPPIGVTTPVTENGVMCSSPAMNWPDFPEGTTNIECWHLYGEEYFYRARIDGNIVFCAEGDGCTTS
jgi:prepilin-type N-terminal cleavage/methylation domain-containing protein